jgi:hypothetical protein
MRQVALLAAVLLSAWHVHSKLVLNRLKEPNYSTTNYFMYDLDPPHYGERFSTRKRYALSAFRFVQELAALHSDTRWVLVLAPFTDTLDGYRDFHGWRHSFDFEELKKAYPHVIDYDQFVAKHGLHPVHLQVLESRHNSPDCRSIDTKGFPPYSLDLRGDKMIAMKQELMVADAACITRDNLAEKVVNATGGQDGAAVFVTSFFYKMTEENSWVLRKHWAFSSIILEEAARFQR